VKSISGSNCSRNARYIALFRERERERERENERKVKKYFDLREREREREEIYGKKGKECN